MTSLWVTILLVFFCNASFAAAGRYSGAKSSNGPFLMVGGSYGMMAINPTDINISAGQQSTTPRFNNIFSGTSYEAFVDWRFAEKFSFRVTYGSWTAKNYISSTSPAGTDNGFTLAQDFISSSINYYLVRVYSGGAGYFLYSGLSVGMPMTSTVSLRRGTVVTDYTADKTLGYGGQMGLGFNLGENLVILAQASYLLYKSGDVKTSNGQYLSYVSGGTNKRAIVDWTGARGEISLALAF